MGFILCNMKLHAWWCSVWHTFIYRE